VPETPQVVLLLSPDRLSLMMLKIIILRSEGKLTSCSQLHQALCLTFGPRSSFTANATAVALKIQQCRFKQCIDRQVRSISVYWHNVCYTLNDECDIVKNSHRSKRSWSLWHRSSAKRANSGTNIRFWTFSDNNMHWVLLLCKWTFLDKGESGNTDTSITTFHCSNS